jgi:RimJ/RimL family protein N-acetyltransferase
MLTLYTDRLIIRDLTLEDIEHIIAYSQDPRHRAYEPDEERTPEVFRDILRWVVNARYSEPREYFYVGVTLADEPTRFIGSVHISIRDARHRQAEVGYSFDVNAWGKGYCTEAARAMVGYAFEALDMHRVYAADIVSENVASVRVAQKLGMRQEAHHRHAFFFRDRWWDSLTFAILADEWHSANG